MALLSTLKRLFSGRSGSFVVVWREHVTSQTTMRAEPIPAKSDTEAISMVRSKFKSAGSDWVFWVLFRPGDEMVTAESGPQIAKWMHSFSRVGTDSHVRSALRAFRVDGKPVTRSIQKVMLKARGPMLGIEGD